MNVASYSLGFLNFGIIKHSDHATPLVHDNLTGRELDVQVRSGDYFVQLATTLDALQALEHTDEISRALNKLVQDLLYLQAHYAISKKH